MTAKIGAFERAKNRPDCTKARTSAALCEAAPYQTLQQKKISSPKGFAYSCPLPMPPAKAFASCGPQTSFARAFRHAVFAAAKAILKISKLPCTLSHRNIKSIATHSITITNISKPPPQPTNQNPFLYKYAIPPVSLSIKGEFRRSGHDVFLLRKSHPAGKVTVPRRLQRPRRAQMVPIAR